MSTRLTVVLGALMAAALLGPPTSSMAQEAEPPTRLRPGLHLAQGATYRYEYTETTSTEGDVTGPRKSSTHQNAVVTWSVSVELVEKRDDGTATVKVVVDRLHGEYDSEKIEPTTFDSASDPTRSDLERITSGESLLEVSAAGVVTKATGVATMMVGNSEGEEKASRACLVFQWLFPPLPDAELARGKKVVQERVFAPNLFVSGIHDCGRIEETAAIRSIVDGRAELKISAKGSYRAEKSGGKGDTVPKTPTKWKFTGQAAIDLTTGLYTSLSTTCDVDTYTRIPVSKPPIEIRGSYDVERTLRMLPPADDE